MDDPKRYKTGLSNVRLLAISQEMAAIREDIWGLKEDIIYLNRKKAELTREARGFTRDRYKDENGLLNLYEARNRCWDAGMQIKWDAAANAAKRQELKGHKYKNSWFFDPQAVDEFISAAQTSDGDRRRHK